MIFFAEILNDIFQKINDILVNITIFMKLAN